MTRGDRIKKLRLDLGLTLQNVADAVGVSAPSVHGWERGAVIKSDKIDAVARALHTTPAYLLGLEDVARSKMRKIPVYESVSAGFGVSADDHVVGWRELWIDSDAEAAATLYIRAVGDSMAPRIQDGDLLRVLKVESVDAGRIGVFLIDGEMGVVKQAQYEPGCDWLVLHSLNPAFRDLRFQGDEELSRVRVLGLVKGCEWE